MGRAIDRFKVTLAWFGTDRVFTRVVFACAVLLMLAAIVLLNGCSLLSPEAYAAKSEVFRTNARGAFLLADSLTDDADEETEFREVAADVAHWKSLIGSTTTTLEMFLADRAATRQKIAAYRANKMVRVEEANELGANLMNGKALVEKEAKVAARIKALTGGTGNATRPN